MSNKLSKVQLNKLINIIESLDPKQRKLIENELEDIKLDLATELSHLLTEIDDKYSAIQISTKKDNSGSADECIFTFTIYGVKIGIVKIYHNLNMRTKKWNFVGSSIMDQQLLEDIKGCIQFLPV